MSKYIVTWKEEIPNSHCDEKPQVNYKLFIFDSFEELAEARKMNGERPDEVVYKLEELDKFELNSSILDYLVNKKVQEVKK